MTVTWATVEPESYDALSLLADQEAARDPLFAEFVAAGRRAGRALLATADELAAGNAADGEQAGQLRRYHAAELATEPFTGAARMVRDHLIAAIGKARPDISSQDKDAVSARMGDPDSAAAAEIRNLYRIAGLVAADPEARDLVVDRSGKGAARGIAADFPSIQSEVQHHLEEFGWVRTAGTDLEPLTGREMMQRIQPALLRWDDSMIRRASQEPARPATSDEDPELVPLVNAYRVVAGDISFSPGLGAKARWVARSFFQQVASVLDCPAALLKLASTGEILAAVTGEVPLKSELVAQRAGSSVVLTGQSVSLGRAVGRVRILLSDDDDHKLGVGDILVTDLSTPNYEGQVSVFPYRGIASVSVDKTAAVITDEGGLLSHAAIICRENQVPTVLGAEGATETLRDGMIVEVDATKGDGKVTILQG